MARPSNTKRDGSSFDAATIEAVWQKGRQYSDPNRPEIRIDACGARMWRGDYGKTADAWGWEIDHIMPVSKGGGDELSNLQPLQWENNRHKGDDYPNWTCKVKG